MAEKLNALAERTSDDIDEAMSFYQGMLARLVVSMLKSADIKDTINSYDTVIEEEDEAALRALVEDFEARILAAYAAYGPPKDGIARGRARIADAVLARSKADSGGIYTLDLPTGAGKTLLSLRYGVNQMKYRRKRRFFYITSYLSVLEQNAETMKKTLGHKDQVLEHHSMWWKMRKMKRLVVRKMKNRIPSRRCSANFYWAIGHRLWCLPPWCNFSTPCLKENPPISPALNPSSMVWSFWTRCNPCPRTCST